ncbi:zinc finger domain-containing protein [Nocardia brasiliensis]|uniref:zinc finger domain-containing protein n=1 Tax=Nocardia brasiliensis TaxID=37326 RepID=UPI002455768B|nr:hypothetical protein [Nocardia brasiliensis]
MTASVVQLSDYRARRRAAPPLVLQVACPYCGAEPTRRCVRRGTPVVRLHGPHRAREVAAELALTEGTGQHDR